MQKTDTCYLCGSKNTRPAFKKLSHEIWLCDKCGLFSLKFDYNYDKFIHEYYQKGYFTGNKKLRAYADYEGDQRTIKMNMRNYLNCIKHYLNNKGGVANVFFSKKPDPIPSLPRDGREYCKKIFASHQNLKLLDCGCAMGYFMEEAKQLGFDSYGVDISHYAADKAKKMFGKKIRISTVENIDSLFKNERFDVITMFDLIEHLKNPRLVLLKLRKLLNKNGIIVLQTGDVSSKWATLQGPNWHFFAPPQHLHFFNRDTITRLLCQSGFKVTEVLTEGKWVSLRYLFHMMRYANKDRLGDFLYRITHKNIVGKIPILFKLGDNMIVIAKRDHPPRV